MTDTLCIDCNEVVDGDIDGNFAQVWADRTGREDPTECPVTGEQHEVPFRPF